MNSGLRVWLVGAVAACAAAVVALVFVLISPLLAVVTGRWGLSIFAISLPSQESPAPDVLAQPVAVKEPVPHAGDSPFLPDPPAPGPEKIPDIAPERPRAAAEPPSGRAGDDPPGKSPSGATVAAGEATAGAGVPDAQAAGGPSGEPVSAGPKKAQLPTDGRQQRDASDESKADAGKAAQAEKQIVAVMPFENRTDSAEYEPLAANMADFMAAARQAGRVMTSEQFRRRREASIRWSSPLTRAKWRLSLGRFEEARGLCLAVLDRDPTSVEALLMMGLLHEPNCLAQPERALEYYGRPPRMEHDPPAAFAGLLHQHRLLITARQYARARRIGKAIRKRCPHNTWAGTLSQCERILAERIRTTEGRGK